MRLARARTVAVGGRIGTGAGRRGAGGTIDASLLWVSQHATSRVGSRGARGAASAAGARRAYGWRERFTFGGGASVHATLWPQRLLALVARTPGAPSRCPGLTLAVGRRVGAGRAAGAARARQARRRGICQVAAWRVLALGAQQGARRHTVLAGAADLDCGVENAAQGRSGARLLSTHLAQAAWAPSRARRPAWLRVRPPGRARPAPSRRRPACVAPSALTAHPSSRPLRRCPGRRWWCLGRTWCRPGSGFRPCRPRTSNRARRCCSPRRPCPRRTWLQEAGRGRRGGGAARGGSGEAREWASRVQAGRPF